MSAENAFCNAAGLKEHEAQQNGIAHRTPNSADGISACGDTLYQHRVDRHADKDQQPLEAHGKQGLDVVLPGGAKLPVGEGRHRDGRKARQHIDLQHTPIGDDENHNAEYLHRQPHHKRLHEQPQQRPDVHSLQRGLQIIQHIRGYIGGALYQPRRIVDHALRHIEYRHNDIECVGENEDRRPGFEHPLEENPSVDVVQVVAVNEHLDQLIGGNESQDQSGDRQYHRFGKLAYE